MKSGKPDFIVRDKTIDRLADPRSPDRAGPNLVRRMGARYAGVGSADFALDAHDRESVLDAMRSMGDGAPTTGGQKPTGL